MAEVKCIDLRKVNVGEYVTIDNHEGLFIPEIFHVPNSTACPQDGWLIPSIDGDAIVLSFDGLIDLFGQVVGIDDHGLTAGVFEPANQDIDQRLAKDGKKGFGCLLGQGQQARAKACRQDHRLHTRHHASPENRCQGGRGAEEVSKNIVLCGAPC